MPRERTAPAAIDLGRAARRLARLRTAALVAAGALVGLASDRTRPPLAQATFAMSLPAVRCPPPYRILPFDEVRLPAGLLAGRLPYDAEVPAPLRDVFLACRLSPEGDRTLASCAMRGPGAPLVGELAGTAERELARPGSALSIAVADLRLLGTCGPDYLAQLLTGDEGLSDPRAGYPAMPALRAARLPLMEDAAARPAPAIPAPRPPAGGPLLGAAAGALLAALLAAARSRGPAEPPWAAPATGRLGRAALAGLMLTAGMDQALAVGLGAFKVRLGQLCALGLLAAVIAERRRWGRALALPAAPVFAALAYLLVCALSALRSDYPAKSAGYLGWAGFDLAVVFAGLVLFAPTEGRLEAALRWWWRGMALAAAMGAVQIATWLLGGRPPLVSTDITGFPRINGFNYEPSYYALYLLPGALVLAARFARPGRRSRAEGALATALLLAAALSTSRSGWMGALAAGPLLALLTAAHYGARSAIRVCLGGAACAAALGIVLLAWPAMRLQTVKMARMALNPREVTSSGPRLESMRQAAVLVERHPMLGVGFGNYGAYVLAHPELPNPRPSDAKSMVTTNLYLEIASETGGLGLVAALAMLGALLVPQWRSLWARSGARAGARLLATRGGLLVAELIVFLVLFQFSQTLWRLDVWVLLSLGFAAARAEPSLEGAAAESSGQGRSGNRSP